tara:strand:- start:2362 stop:2760 length:399 start_codon:yes stop_codon:yes gene_type:complete
MRYLPLALLAGCQQKVAGITDSLKGVMPSSPAVSQATVTAEQAQIHQSLFPLSLVGGIAVFAGIIAMLFLPSRTGQRALVIGVVLCLIPPSFLLLGPELLKPVAQVVAIISLVLLVFYTARVWERKRYNKDA